MRTRSLALLALALAPLAGCDRWDGLPDGWGRSLARAPWSPGEVSVAVDALYVPLPQAGDLARIRPSAETTIVDLGDDRFVSAHPAPDGTTLLVRAERSLCDDVDCFEPFVEGYAHVIREGQTVGNPIPFGAWYRPPAFSDDARYAVSPIDGDAAIEGGGLVSLTSVRVVDVVAAESWDVSVGFDATRVFFTTDGAGTTTGMLVLSSNEVALVDLAGRAPRPSVTFPLTLDDDTPIQPLDIGLTPDGTTAIVTMSGLSDLYVLDLENPRVNIVELSGPASDLEVDEARDQTLLVSATRPTLEIVDHLSFGVQTIALDQPMRRVRIVGDAAILWSSAGTDAYRYDLETGELVEYNLLAGPTRLDIAPDGAFALAFHGDFGAARMEVLNLTRDPEGDFDDDTVGFALSDRAVGVAFDTREDGGTDAIVLARDEDTLYRLAWPSLGVQEVDLAAPPVDIGAWADGGFWITHDVSLGLISFYEPDSGFTEVAGFARLGLLSPPTEPLPVEEDE